MEHFDTDLQNLMVKGKQQGYLTAILDEIVKQSKVEFNYSEDTGAEGDDEETPRSSADPEPS